MEVYRLRVMECKECGKTHRELPEWIVPYKRMDVELLSVISEVAEERCLGETEAGTWRRVKAWVAWFLAYALNVLKSVQVTLGRGFPTIPSGDSLHRKLAYFVRLVVNSGQWAQHRSDVKRGT